MIIIKKIFYEETQNTKRWFSWRSSKNHKYISLKGGKYKIDNKIGENHLSLKLGLKI